LRDSFCTFVSRLVGGIKRTRTSKAGDFSPLPPIRFLALFCTLFCHAEFISASIPPGV